MAAQFVGSTVSITLSEPPGEKVRGQVKSVNVGQALTLCKVISTLTGTYYPVLVIPSSIILDVEVEPKEKTMEWVKQPAVIDPAIVSFKRGSVAEVPANGQGKIERPELLITDSQVQPVQFKGKFSSLPHGDIQNNGLQAYPHTQQPSTRSPSSRNGAPPEALVADISAQPAKLQTELHSVPHNVARNNPLEVSSQSKKRVNESQMSNGAPRTHTLPDPQPAQLAPRGLAQTNGAHKVWKQRAAPAANVMSSATLTGPFSALPPNRDIYGDGTGSRPPAPAEIPKPPVRIAHPLPARKEFLTPKKTSKRGKRAGKTQTKPTNTGIAPNAPFATLDEEITACQQPEGSIVHNKIRKERYKGIDHTDQNGWATGDATDIQDMGDFDFEQELSKFDKRKVFDQIRQEDTTADEERLHTFNRRPRPGTAGGKNLHHTENVLESHRQIAAEHSSADDDTNLSDFIRRGSRSLREMSRKAPSRQGSGIVATDTHMTASGSLIGFRESQPMSKVPSSNPSLSVIRNYSLPRRTSTQLPQSSLRIVGTDWPCPCVSPVQMLELEQLAISEFDISEDMLTENASRSIAQGVLDIAREEPHEMENLGNVIVILTANTKTGSRTIAAARHLCNHGRRVILCMLGLERREDMLENVRRQLKIYRNCGGKVFRPDELIKRIKSLSAPVGVVVDAMLGMHLSYDDLTNGDQTSFFYLVKWANVQECNLISIDIPSGVDASTGLVSRAENEDVAILATHVLSLGAPKIGLLLGQCDEYYRGLEHRKFCVADIGIPNAAWKRFGKKSKHGVPFRSKWVAELEYCDA